MRAGGAWRQLQGEAQHRVSLCCARMLLPLNRSLPPLPPSQVQASQRAAFLRDCKRPLSNLGPLWSAVHSVVRRFSREAPEEPEDAHVD